MATAWGWAPEEEGTCDLPENKVWRNIANLPGNVADMFHDWVVSLGNGSAGGGRGEERVNTCSSEYHKPLFFPPATGC